MLLKKCFSKVAAVRTSIDHVIPKLHNLPLAVGRTEQIRISELRTVALFRLCDAFSPPESCAAQRVASRTASRVSSRLNCASRFPTTRSTGTPAQHHSRFPLESCLCRV